MEFINPRAISHRDSATEIQLWQVMITRRILYGMSVLKKPKRGEDALQRQNTPSAQAVGNPRSVDYSSQFKSVYRSLVNSNTRCDAPALGMVPVKDA
jgi:hypothetical protein